MWALGQWDRDHFEAYMSELPRDTYDGLFFRAVYSIHLNDYECSQGFIRQARDILGALLQNLLLFACDHCFKYVVSFVGTSYHDLKVIKQ